MGAPCRSGDIASIKDLPRGTTIPFAGSGGLDSMTIVHWLKHVHGMNIIVLLGDVGQPDETKIDDARDRMLASGAAEVHVMPLQEMLAEAGWKAIQAQARYQGPYYQSTGIARHVIGAGIAQELVKRDNLFLAHGCTGRGNDQVRFQVILNHLLPKAGLYAPWRDETFLSMFRGRQEMISYCQSHGLPIRATAAAPYSTDASLLGLTHEAGDLEDLETSPFIVKPGMGCWYKDAPREPATFVVRFEAGRPVAINGEEMNLVEVFKAANRAGGAAGIGIVEQVEDRLLGPKGRGVYEQQGMEVLHTAYDALLQLVLDAKSRTLLKTVSETLGGVIYAGEWFDICGSMCDRVASAIARFVTGTVQLSLCMGHATVTSRTLVPASRYDADTVSMEARGTFDHHDSEGALKIRSIGARGSASTGQIEPDRFVRKEVA